MNNREEKISEFFDHYCDVFNHALKNEDHDPDSTAELFATCFIGADPHGVNCGNNDEAFREAMQKGYSFYRMIGITSMKIVAKTITLLDDFHAIVKIRWSSGFLKKDGSENRLEFENIYFIQSRNDQNKVFAYITGDEQAALKEAGLI